jgi:hypothetical protein
MTILTAADELRFRLRGGLHVPGHPEYADACELFNAMIETRPRYVARCTAPDDVIAALAFARDEDLPVAVRGGGHSVAGLSLCEDGLVLDVRGMDEVTVDPPARIASRGRRLHVGAGRPRDAGHGLATTGGRVSSTGVAGLMMGGGPLARAQARSGLRQTRRRRDRDGRRPPRARFRHRAPRPLLGAARRRRQLRRRVRAGARPCTRSGPRSSPGS